MKMGMVKKSSSFSIPGFFLSAVPCIWREIDVNVHSPEGAGVATAFLALELLSPVVAREPFSQYLFPPHSFLPLVS